MQEDAWKAWNALANLDCMESSFLQAWRKAPIPLLLCRVHWSKNGGVDSLN